MFACKGDRKRDSYHLPTAFCCDVLLECYHIGKRLDWYQIHPWKESGQSVPVFASSMKKGNVEHNTLYSHP